MGAPSLAEDASERRDEDAHGYGGTVGPVGGKTASLFVPPSQASPLASGRKRTTTTPKQEFEQTFRRLWRATRSLRETLDEMASENCWQGFVRAAEEIRDAWAHLAGEDSDSPVPEYEDYHAVQKTYRDLVGVTARLFDPECVVAKVLIELGDQCQQRNEWKPDHFQQDTKRQAKELLAVCERIKDAEYNLDHLLDHPDFDAHSDRYYDESESRK